MKFAHLADCHIGSWRDPKLKQVSIDAFTKAVDAIIENEVDFVLISGDLFNTSMPSVDVLKTTVIKLELLRKRGIPVYIIAGSHDFSPSGKTMLDVLEHAGLFINVVKGKVLNERLVLNFTIDKKTGAKITGMLGKKGMLEKSYYEALDKDHLEQEPGFKIFMFHTAITELKPKELEKMDSSPISFLPKNFNYYAGGHVHVIMEKESPPYSKIIYPGPLFPNSFSELEKLGRGGFYIYDNGKIDYHPVQVCNSHSIVIDAEGKNPDKIEEELLELAAKQEFINTIVTIRIQGTLERGKASDIDFTKIFKEIYGRGAYFVMKNTSSLLSKEFEEIKTESGNVDDIEDSIIKEHLNQIKVKGMSKEREFELTKQLMHSLDKERDEGERVTDFEAKLKEEIMAILEFDE